MNHGITMETWEVAKLSCHHCKVNLAASSSSQDRNTFGLGCECEQIPSDATIHTLPALPLPGGWNGAQQLRIRQNVVKGQAKNNFLWNRANPFIGTATAQQKRQLSNTNGYKQLSFIIIFPYLLAWLMAVSLQWALSTCDLTLPQTSMSWTEKIWRQI